MSGSTTPLPPVSGRPSARAPTNRVAVVVNGNAKQVTTDLVEILDQIVQSGDLFVSRSLEEGQEIADTIVKRGYPTVLTGGGDGTFVQMVTWITRRADAVGHPYPRFGLLRLGTGNALAWVLGAQSPNERGVVADLARLRKEAGTRPLWLLDIEGSLTPFAGLGIDAIALKHFVEVKETVQKLPVVRRLARGGVTYFASILTRSLPEYLFRAHPEVRIVNEGSDALCLGTDGQPIGAPVRAGQLIYEGPSRMVCMSTIPYWGFGARIFPFADDREDRFSLRVVDVGSLDVAFHLREIWKGTYRHDRVHDFLVDHVSIAYKTPMPMQIGGDLVGSRTLVHVSLAQKPIQVIDYYSPPAID